VFLNQRNLTHLSLNRNQLQELPAGIFDSLVGATQIDLGHNQLKSLPENLFAKNGNLSAFSLVENGDLCIGPPSDCHPQLRLRY
jgi:Leucine-rich repeat (LRR) protein